MNKIPIYNEKNERMFDVEYDEHNNASIIIIKEGKYLKTIPITYMQEKIENGKKVS